jgi:hypothetical protein
VDLGDGGTDHLVRRDGTVVAEDVLCGVVAVDVRGDEVERDVIGRGVGDHVADPGGLRGSGASDADARVDAFEGAGGVVVQLEVGLLGGAASPEIDVGLVPDFEVPLRDFIDAVALDEVLGEGDDEGVPPSPWAERRSACTRRRGSRGARQASLGMKLISTKGRTPLASRPS